MDQQPPASSTTRGLAWAVACLLVAGAVSAGALIVRDRPGRAVVSAAGDQQGTVDVTSTVTVPLAPPPSTPTPTVAPSTTLPKAAVDVLNAIGGSTTTTRPRATTTRPPAPTTTVPAPTPTTVAPSTTTTVPAPYRATLVNQHTQAVVLNVNGRNIPLTPGQTLDLELPMSLRGDLVQVRLAEDNRCGVSDSGLIFKSGGNYAVTIIESDTMCSDTAARIPLLRIGPK
jgi:hypothetical protein